MKAEITIRRIMTPGRGRIDATWGLYSDVDDACSSKVSKLPATPLPAPYEMREIDGKGIGMIATRTIKRGELIVSERPVLMTPRLLASYRQLEGCLLQLLLCLEQEDRERVVQLHNCKSLDECGPLAGILRTNGLGATFPQSQVCSQYLAVCLDISRFNHSCSPNANYFLDKESVIFSLIACRDISLGEEITINYLDEGLTRAERQSELKQKYLFTCTCELCSAPAAVITESDERRMGVRSKLDSVTSTFDYWMMLSPREKKEKLKDCVEIVDTFLRIMEAEDLHRERLEVLKIPIYMYAAARDSSNFRIWVGRILQYLKVMKELTGRKHTSWAEELWGGWLKDPTSFPFWNFINSGVGNVMQKMERFGPSVHAIL